MYFSSKLLIYSPLPPPFPFRNASFLSLCVFLRGLGKAICYVECLSHPPPPVMSTPRVKQSWGDSPDSAEKTCSVSLRYSSLSCLFSSAFDKVRAVGLVASWAARGGHTLAGLPTSAPVPLMTSWAAPGDSSCLSSAAPSSLWYLVFPLFSAQLSFLLL